MPPPNAPVRPIPANPNLEFDRKQAKSLLDAALRGDSGALRRFASHHPRASTLGDPALSDAHLVIAREYGFASWPQWKQFVETRRLDLSQRAAALLKAATSNDVRKAAVMLQAEPSLARHDIFTAAACGEPVAVAQFLARDAALARAKGGPLNIEPLLYACFSRFLRADPTRAEGIFQSAKLLLQAGANPNAHFWHQGDNERWLQSTLYGSAGIANHAPLTTLLLDSGATIHSDDKEVLYHTTEYPDTTCLNLILSRGNPPLHNVKYCLGRALDFEYPAHVALFLKAGADPNFGSRESHLHKALHVGRSAAIIKMLLDAGGDPAVVAHFRSHSLPGNSIALCLAAARDDLAAIDRLLDAGAPIDTPAGNDRMTPLHNAAWRGRLRAVQRLVERGADIHKLNAYGGAALGCAIHGSANCSDPEGGPTMRLPEESSHGDYPAIVEYLIAKGVPLPDRITDGSDPVQEILRRHGVPDAE